MRNHPLLLLLFTYLATVALYGSLYELSTIRVDPVRFVAPGPDEPSFRQHGKPVLSVAGAAAWLLVISIYVVSVCLVIARRAGRRRLHVRLLTFLLALAASLLTVALVHPLLSPLLMPQAWRSPYVQWLQAVHFPVGAAHISFNMFGILTYVSAVHAAVMLFVICGRTKDASRGASI